MNNKTIVHDARHLCTRLSNVTLYFKGQTSDTICQYSFHDGVILLLLGSVRNDDDDGYENVT